jgi:hypothetical protein
MLDGRGGLVMAGGGQMLPIGNTSERKCAAAKRRLLCERKRHTTFMRDA